MVTFTPFIKISVNITQTLNEAAKDRKIAKEDVDFDLISVVTLIRSSEYSEWTIFKEPVEKIFDEQVLRSEDLQIRQEYKIKIKPYEINEQLKDVKIEIISNKTKSKVIAIFKQGSIFPCTKDLAKLLKKEINRQKLKLGFLILSFEGNLNATLIKLSKVIKCNTPLTKDIRISIAESPEPIFAIDDAIILHYLKTEKQKKSLIEAVEPDELIFEYIKPKKGIDGRSCNGEYVMVSQPQRKFAHYKANETTVRVVDTENSIQYYAKIDGYVKNIDAIISVSQEVSIETASFRYTGSIDSGNKKNISVNIESTDTKDDAVGSGVNIDVEHLNIKGTVGSYTKVRANDLSIGQQTHRSSHLEAVEHAQIHLHRGNLKAKTATIDILENGTIQADDVYVKKMLGGEIIAKRVIVEELTSNATVIASELIEIHAISGEHNQLTINPKKIETFYEAIESLKQELKAEKTIFLSLKKAHLQKFLEHKEQLNRMKVFQKRILEATKASTAPNKIDIIRIKQYKKDGEAMKLAAENIENEEKKLSQIEQKLENMYEAEFHGKIKYTGNYDGTTQVSFIDVKTSQSYSLSPQGIHQEIFLKKDGEYKVINIQ